MKAKYPALKVEVSSITVREHEKRVALALPGGSAAEVLELANTSARRYSEAGLLKPVLPETAAFVGSDARFDPFLQKVAGWQGKL